ncbi:MAG: hypothetical protein H8E40_10595 [Chloroflexi bacterium]|nr:hypothetical protein [Chloroflexota bacterium]
MAKLIAAKRKALPGSAFAVDHAKRKYPIQDKAHARNALARVAQHGTAAEIAAVRRKVKAKYPSIEVGGKK